MQPRAVSRAWFINGSFVRNGVAHRWDGCSSGVKAWRGTPFRLNWDSLDKPERERGFPRLHVELAFGAALGALSSTPALARHWTTGQVWHSATALPRVDRADCSAGLWNISVPDFPPDFVLCSPFQVSLPQRAVPPDFRAAGHEVWGRAGTEPHGIVSSVCTGDGFPGAQWFLV